VPCRNFIQMHFIYVDLPHPKHLTVKMVAAYSSETLISNTILRDATSQNTVILKRTVLKLL